MANQVSQPGTTTIAKIQDGVPILFFREVSIFGDKRPQQSDRIKHSEMYESISKSINATHITGLQRVRGMWRIYI